MNKRIIAPLILLMVISGCKINRLTNINIPDAYDSKANFTEFNQVVYHVNDSVSRIFFRLNTTGLLFSKDNADSKYKAKYRIRYELINEADPKNISDSTSFHFVDSVNFTLRRQVVDSFDIKIRQQGKYLLNFSITDLNRKNFSVNYVRIDKQQYACRHNFMLKDGQGNVVFPPDLNDFSNLRVYASDKQRPRLFVRYYKREYPLALPPFVEIREKGLSFKPDSVFFVEMDDGVSEPMLLLGRGIYHFQEDTTGREGYTLFRFHDDFPTVSTADQMLYPLRYITTKTEFNDLMMMKNTKEAVDQFWLDKSGNPDRAREKIRKYYNRVIDANRFFTSYHEGWKTDRGMIYIVYGTPNLVYKNPETETWIYGEDRNVLSITFNFNRISNPFTDNDFGLSRSQEYKNTWYTAVDGWRN